MVKLTDYRKMRNLQILAIVTIFIGTSFAGYAPSKEDLDSMDRVRTRESVGECMCPPNINTTGTWVEFCGQELAQPKKCSPQSVYRCVNMRKIAIETYRRCEKWAEICQPQTSINGGPCPFCKPHALKECVKLSI